MFFSRFSVRCCRLHICAPTYIVTSFLWRFSFLLTPFSKSSAKQNILGEEGCHARAEERCLPCLVLFCRQAGGMKGMVQCVLTAQCMRRQETTCPNPGHMPKKRRWEYSRHARHAHQTMEGDKREIPLLFLILPLLHSGARQAR